MSDASSPRPRMRGWVKAVLIVSLCLNVLAAGAFGGLFLRHDRDGPGRFAIQRIIHILPESKRDAARAALEAKRPEFEALREKIRAARQESADLLAADPLDEAALRASVEKSRALAAERRVMVEDAFLGFAVTLSPEERKALAERLKRGHRGWRKAHDREERRESN